MINSEARASLVDVAHQWAFWLRFRLALMRWRFSKPSCRGSLVMLWRGDQVLLVRTSYTPGWHAPGGGIEPGERPIEAALRELEEEIGLVLEESDLRLALTTEYEWNFRQDRAFIFEAEMPTNQAIKLDLREIIEVRMVPLETARQFQMPPHILEYLSMANSARDRRQS